MPGRTGRRRVISRQSQVSTRVRSYEAAQLQLLHLANFQEGAKIGSVWRPACCYSVARTEAILRGPHNAMWHLATWVGPAA